MSQLDPALGLEVAAPPPARVRGRLHVPGWLFTKGATPAVLGSFANVVFVGMVLAGVAWRIPSLWACVAVHFVNNAWSEGLVLALFR